MVRPPWARPVAPLFYCAHCMNESDVRHVLLLQAVETAEGGRPAAAWTPHDAAWASSAAWREVGEQAAAPAFFVQRARMGLLKPTGSAPSIRWCAALPYRAGLYGRPSTRSAG